jgi:hypothetical protein
MLKKSYYNNMYQDLTDNLELYENPKDKMNKESQENEDSSKSDSSNSDSEKS